MRITRKSLIISSITVVILLLSAYLSAEFLLGKYIIWKFNKDYNGILRIDNLKIWKGELSGLKLYSSDGKKLLSISEGSFKTKISKVLQKKIIFNRLEAHDIRLDLKLNKKTFMPDELIRALTPKIKTKPLYIKLSSIDINGNALVSSKYGVFSTNFSVTGKLEKSKNNKINTLLKGEITLNKIKKAPESIKQLAELFSTKKIVFDLNANEQFISVSGKFFIGEIRLDYDLKWVKSKLVKINISIHNLVKILKNFTKTKPINGNPVLHIKGQNKILFDLEPFYIRNTKIKTVFKGEMNKHFPSIIRFENQNNKIVLKGSLFPEPELKGTSVLNIQHPFPVRAKGNIKAMLLNKEWIFLSIKGKSEFQYKTKHVFSHLINVFINVKRPDQSYVSASAENELLNIMIKGKITEKQPDLEILIKSKKNMRFKKLSIGKSTIKGRITGTWKNPTIISEISSENVKYSWIRGKLKGILFVDKQGFTMNGNIKTPFGTFHIKHNYKFGTSKSETSLFSNKINFQYKGLSSKGKLFLSSRNKNWDMNLNISKIKYGKSRKIKIARNAKGKINVRGKGTSINFFRFAFKGKNFRLKGRSNSGGIKANIILNGYKIEIPVNNYILKAKLSGKLKAELATDLLYSKKKFFSKIKKISGSVKIHDISFPLLRNLDEINLRVYPGIDNAGVMQGEMGESLRFSGFINKSGLHAKADFAGLEINKHVLASVGKYVNILMDGALTIKYSDKLTAESKLRGLMIKIKQPFSKKRKPILIRNYGNFDATYKNGKIFYSHSKLILGSGDILELNGYISPEKTNLKLSGKFDFSTFSEWKPQNILTPRGKADFILSLSGNSEKPFVKLKIKAKKTILGTMQGKIYAHNTMLEVTSDKLTFSSELKKKRKSLRIKGLLTLNNFKPDKISVFAKGEIPGELFKMFASEILAAADGSCSTDIVISGDFKHPSVKGFLKPTDLNLKIRSYPHKLNIKTGILLIENEHVKFDDIGIIYDDDTRIKLNGKIDFEKTVKTDLNVELTAFPLVKKAVYTSEFNGKLRLFGTKKKLKLSGKIDLTTAKYIQKFDIVKKILTVHRYNEQTYPLWRDYPWIGKTKLNIAVFSTGDMEVSNNLANLSLDGIANLKGTLSDPKLQGQINITQGNFTIPFFRGTYDVTSGSINFDKGDTPYLILEGNTNVPDLTGNDILINLKLKGFINKIDFSFNSIPQMEQGQILMLLASGKTTKDLRKMYHGDPKSGTGISSGGFNPLVAYDQPIKQITGDFLSSLVANPIKMVTKLDLIRFELGSDSFQLRISKTFLNHVKLNGEVEVGLLGKQRQEGGVQVKLHDRFLIDANVRRYVPGLNEYEYENPLKARIQLKYKIKLSGGIRDILGY